jgi:hypothetical protein
MAEEITVVEVQDLADAKMRKIMMRVVKEMEVAVEKTVAHHAEPANFPLPDDPNSVEQVLSARFTRLNPAQKQFAKTKMLSRTKASKESRKKILGDLAEVDLRSKSPVAEQVDRLAFPPALKTSLQSIKNMTQIHGQIVSVKPAGLVPQQTTDNLEFRIHRVKCVDETGKDFNPFGDEFGSDEISLAGTSVDENGDTKKVSEFKVGNFDDGDVKSFSPPRRFTFFNLREGTQFPKSYFVTLVLAEKDEGGLSDFVNKLLEKIKERVIAYLAAALGGAIGASGGPVGALIGAAVGFIVGKVFEFIKSVFADDIFPPKTISVAIPSLTHRFAGGRTDSPEIVTRFVGHDGTYDITSDWRLFA